MTRSCRHRRVGSVIPSLNTRRVSQPFISSRLQVHSQMQSLFTVKVFKSGTTSFIEKGFLNVIVTQTAHPFRTRHFMCCLHCRKLRSPSWFYEHKKELVFDVTPDMLAGFHANYTKYERDIVTEVELLSDLGRLFHVFRRKEGASSSFDMQRGPPSDQMGHEDDGHDFHSDLPPVMDLEEQPDSDGGALNDNSQEMERLVDCVSQCFEDYCFMANSFDIMKFASLFCVILQMNTTETTPSSTRFKKSKLTFFRI